MPADNVEGMRADVIAATREMKLPLLRWPGGNFVSQHDGAMPSAPGQAARPAGTARGTSGSGATSAPTSSIRFCELVGAEPYICVNAGRGPRDRSRGLGAVLQRPPGRNLGQGPSRQRTFGAVRGEGLEHRQRDVGSWHTGA